MSQIGDRIKAQLAKLEAQLGKLEGAAKERLKTLLAQWQRLAAALRARLHVPSTDELQRVSERLDEVARRVERVARGKLKTATAAK